MISLSKLCTPSYIYFIISVLFLGIAGFQNLGNNRNYNLGIFSCDVSSCIMVFIVKLLYIVFWTWILNLMCKDGYSGIAWFLVLIPFILLFVILGLIMSIGLTEPHDTQDEKSKQLVSKELHEKKKNAQHNGNEN